MVKSDQKCSKEEKPMRKSKALTENMRPSWVNATEWVPPQDIYIQIETWSSLDDWNKWNTHSKFLTFNYIKFHAAWNKEATKVTSILLADLISYSTWI